MRTLIIILPFLSFSKLSTSKKIKIYSKRTLFLTENPSVLRWLIIHILYENCFFFSLIATTIYVFHNLEFHEVINKSNKEIWPNLYVAYVTYEKELWQTNKIVSNLSYEDRSTFCHDEQLERLVHVESISYNMRRNRNTASRYSTTPKTNDDDGRPASVPEKWVQYPL